MLEIQFIKETISGSVLVSKSQIACPKSVGLVQDFTTMGTIVDYLTRGITVVPRITSLLQCGRIKGCSVQGDAKARRQHPTVCSFANIVGTVNKSEYNFVSKFVILWL